jgi:hypothetical protein
MPEDEQPQDVERSLQDPSSDADAMLSKLVEDIVDSTLEKRDGATNFWQAWTPEVADRIVSALKEVAIVRANGEHRLASRTETIRGAIQGGVLIAIIVAITYLSAQDMLGTAAAGALGTLAGYLMGKKT